MGYILRTVNRIPENSHRTINAFILHISLPAQILLFVPKISFSSEILLPAGMAWILFLFTFGILFIVNKIVNFNSKNFGCLLLTAGLGNTSFLGLPMIEVFFGKEFSSIGILCDQPGTFLVLSLLGIPLALQKSSLDSDYLLLLKKIITFPPFISFIVAILLSNISFPSQAKSVLQRLGDTLAPLALFSVGFQFKLTGISRIKKELFLGLGVKMIFAPLFILFLYMVLLNNTSMYSKISIFEAAMPPMITGGIVAIENDLNPELASAMIAIGVLVSGLTLPIWYLGLGRLF
ncbi:MAG: AEC family transporter [Leptospiraceae bacterium]|nr:AEC family transporter [Leptospiraceae bacterium]